LKLYLALIRPFGNNRKNKIDGSKNMQDAGAEHQRALFERRKGRCAFQTPHIHEETKSDKGFIFYIYIFASLEINIVKHL
jgi:hypothetical protein